MPTIIKSRTKLIEKGIKALSDSLGADNAMRFVVAIERTDGNSVSQFHNLLKGKSIEAIHKEILAAKAKKLI